MALTMNQRTAHKLKELESYPWFVNVGKPLEGYHLPVENWQQAVDLSAAEVWSSVQHQVKNHIADEVTSRNYCRSEEWNKIAAELRKGIAIVEINSIEPVVRNFRLKPDFRGAVSWDMLMICLETEFSDLIPPMFSVPRLQPIYAAGHFPCGWEGPKLEESWKGELPNWRLMIY